jgi:hypothetical protein
MPLETHLILSGLAKSEKPEVSIGARGGAPGHPAAIAPVDGRTYYFVIRETQGSTTVTQHAMSKGLLPCSAHMSDQQSTGRYITLDHG